MSIVWMKREMIFELVYKWIYSLRLNSTYSTCSFWNLHQIDFNRIVVISFRRFSADQTLIELNISYEFYEILFQKKKKTLKRNHWK